MYCPKCGKDAGDNKFCAFCGFRLDSHDSYKKVFDDSILHNGSFLNSINLFLSKERGFGSTILVYFLIIMVLMVCVFLVYFNYALFFE